MNFNDIQLLYASGPAMVMTGFERLLGLTTVITKEADDVLTNNKVMQVKAAMAANDEKF